LILSKKKGSFASLAQCPFLANIRLLARQLPHSSQSVLLNSSSWCMLFLTIVFSNESAS
jgi:hypothetical protein